MMDSPYSLIIEATEEPDYFGFFSPDLEGFTGIGHSIEDCVYKAKWGMKEHMELLKERGLPVPSRVKSPKIIVQNEDEDGCIGPTTEHKELSLAEAQRNWTPQ